MVKIQYLDTSCFAEEAVYRQAVEQVSAARRKKVEFYRFAKDRYLSLGAGILLTQALGEYGLKNPEITCNFNGKPSIAGNPFYFNLSHSGKFAVCGICDREIGVDIEKNACPDEELIHRVSRPEEEQYLLSLDDALRAEQFSLLWTAKESYMKYLGTGLTLDPLRLEIDFRQPLSIKKDGRAVSVRFKTYNLEEYTITACAQIRDFPRKLVRLDTTELQER